MQNTIEWKPFSLVDKSTLSKRSQVAMSTLNCWQKTRCDRIRYLEYSAYFNLLSPTEKQSFINDPHLSLVQLLAVFSADNKKLTQTIIKNITGESERTLRSWWHSQVGKRAVCLELILGVVTLLLIANKSQYQLYWKASERENYHQGYATERFSTIIEYKAFEKWKSG